MEKKLEMIKRGIECPEYFSIEAINASTIKKFMDSCKKMPDDLYNVAINGEYGLIETFFDKKEPMNSQKEINFAVGTVIHKLCLEEKKFNEQDKFDDKDKYFDDMYHRNTYSCGFLSEMHKDMIKRCYHSWNDSGFALENPQVEMAYFNEYEGMPLKAKIDLVGSMGSEIIVVDLKTISSFHRIKENIKNYYYWFQILYYKLILGYEENNQYVDIIDDLYLAFLSKTELGVKVAKFSELSENEQNMELANFKKYVELFRKYYEWKKALSNN